MALFDGGARIAVLPGDQRVDASVKLACEAAKRKDKDGGTMRRKGSAESRRKRHRLEGVRE